MTTKTKPTIKDRPSELPAEACYFDVGHVQFQHTDEHEENLVPVQVLARSDQPVDHWFWGRVVHDMEGMKSKSSIPIDYCHRSDEIIGFANKFDTSKGLLCDGTLVIDPKAPQDRAREVAYKGANGVPYEASMFFDPNHALVVEHVAEGASVQVNGYEFEGPGCVIREWHLKAITTCPHGADMGTETKFSDSERSIPITYAGTQMSSNNTPTTPSAEQPNSQPNNQTTETKGEADQNTETKDQPAGQGTETTENTPADNPQEPTRAEVLLSKLESLETMFADAQKPKDPLEIIERRIDELAAKFSGKEPPEKSASDRIDELTDQVTKLTAQFSHTTNSSSEAADGGGDDANKDDKPRWRDAFQFAHKRSKN